MYDTPVNIVTRDRVTDLRRLVSWLEDAGYHNIRFLDNGSRYRPLIRYLEASPHETLWLGRNWGSRVLWTYPDNLIPDEPYVLTDPDVVPVEGCPADLLARLQDLLDRYPHIPKAGPGLFLDDLDEDMPSLEWERELVSPGRLLEPDAYESLIDTTFALYRPGAQFSFHAIRTTGNYQFRHTPWYAKPPLSAEDRYYLKRAARGDQGTTWEVAE